MSNEANYSIRDLEKLSGIKAHTLRIWEKRYAVFKPNRTDTNIRYYSNEDLKKILNISLLNKNGYKISSIVSMPSSEISNLVSAINLVKTENEDLVDNLILAMIDMDELFFNKTFNSSLVKLGFENTMVKIIFPFMNRIGTMWQAGTINPAQEHFVSNIIRQKMIVAIDGISIQANARQMETVVLFLRENELHELSILFYNYVLRSRGYNTIYLGQSVPIADLDRIIKIVRPDYLLSIITNSFSKKEWELFNDSISHYSQHSTILLSGYSIYEMESQLDSKIRVFRTMNDLLKIIKAI
jgi:DNA-binding transcriptional MerR regulator